MRRCFHIVLWVVAVAAGLSSCKDDFYDNSPNEPIKLSLTDTLKVGSKASVAHISVSARDVGWTVTGATDWCTPDPTEGEKGITKITVTVTANVAANEGDTVLERKTTLTFTSGDNSKSIVVYQYTTEDIPMPNRHEDFELNREIREKLLDRFYFWNEETKNTTDFDYNQSYSNFFNNFLGKSVKSNANYEGSTWTTGSRRYIYSYIERRPAGTAASNPVPLNYGMEFDLADHGGYYPVGRILYVLPGSPAAKAGLKRGDWFDRVRDINGKLIRMGNWELTGRKGRYQYEDRIDSLVYPIEGYSPGLGMLQYLLDGSLQLTSTSIGITPERFTGSPILYSNSIDTGNVGRPNNLIIEEINAGGETTRTGYLVLLGLDSGSEAELRAEFTRFKELDRPLTHFILDLRYCKSGSVEMAEMVGNLLVPSEADGKIFAKYEFNASSGLSKTVNFTVDPATSLEVPNIIILTSKYTAGAAELLINALRGIDDDGLADLEGSTPRVNEIVRLLVVGDNTEGMNFGMVREIYRSELPGHEMWEYDAWILAFRCVNARDEGDYQYGFTPNGGTITDWSNPKWPVDGRWGWRGGELTTEDPLLDRAMRYVKGIEPMPTGRVMINTQARKRSGYPRDFCFPMNMTMEIN